MTKNKRANEVIAFWIEAGPKKWFQRDDAFDTELTGKFAGLYEEVASGEHDDWMNDPQNCLALILVLDQFSRNMFRENPKAFAHDAKALAAAKLSVERDYASSVPEDLRSFLYMPFMHSENIADQRQSVILQQSLGNANSVNYAKIHLDAIFRFGRFPHRNPVLGRKTTPAEQAYLDGGGFSA